MALFNISGSADWEVNNAAERLCENFSEGSRSKHKRKSKYTDQVKKPDLKAEHKKLREKVAKSVSLLSNLGLLNGRKELLKKIKQKIRRQENLAGNQIALNNSLVVSAHVAYKNTGKTNKVSKKLQNGNTHNVSQSKSEKGDSLSVSKQTQEAEAKNTLKRKKKKNKIVNASKDPLFQEQLQSTGKPQNNSSDPQFLKKRKKQLAKLQKLLPPKEQQLKQVTSKKEYSSLTLRQRMMRKLKAARFRFLNEQIYSATGKETEKIFRSDPEAFKAYHEGYKLQLKRWPLNPLDKIIKSINMMSKSHVIADFGCGEARLAQSIGHQVHSFDLVAANDLVTPCDMAHVPLHDSSVDVAVFCLSLMGTNLKDYLLEANRVLKKGGVLKIAEVESRFEDVEAFIKSCEQYGFRKTWMDLSYNLFYFIDFKKESSSKNKAKLPSITLQPCLYKKR